MKTGLFILCLGVSVILVGALPLDTPNQNEDSSSTSGSQPLVRERRTIGILRDLFPNFSQYVDRKIQMLTRIIFRIVGRLVLQGNRNGNDGGGGGGGGDDDQRISITLPTYAPDLTEDSEDEEDSTGASTVDVDATPSSGGEPTTTINPNGDAENALAAESQVNEVRVKRDVDLDSAASELAGGTVATNGDRQAAPAAEVQTASAEQASSSSASDETVEAADDGKEDLDQEGTDDNEVSEDNDAESSEVEQDDEDPRNKRFLNFNLGGGASADAGGSSGGGSGNFLFDIIRLVAGSGSGSGQSSSSSSDSSSGSGADASASAGAEAGASTSEGKEENAYGVGVPGPLTRLFVVANRGVASLIQDLILRLAQTSERLVNFKARLITSII